MPKFLAPRAMALRSAARTALVAVLLLGVAGCAQGQESLNRELAAPSYMDVPANDQREDDAAAAAVEVLHKFSGGAASKDAWLRDLTAVVTPSLAHQVQDLDPPQLKPLFVHASDLERPEGGEGDQVRVRIGTDVGEWTLVMTRTGEGAPWLASNIFPASIT
ncbi:hypothetical protein J2T11_003211 [Paenarthrobacter nicotinovorans]|uniref:hypothetical protein n=1 Tax=Paenarthrobacter nicotinovorans TaxID=29320 RepID=UPI002786192F|nr:hypothetical protein [Paenarthrobacter nicotinovorans]MDP9936843.1 hypothetical protein [Paenarthrobacter nicotinovorans]